MRKMPQIPEVEKRVKMTTTFSGYNHNEVISDGEMYNTQNLSAYMAPVLATRKKRGITSLDAAGNTPVPLTGIHGRDKLVFIRGTEVFYNLAKVNGLSVSANENMLPKKIVSMGAYVCIWPDKVYFNTIDLTDYGSMQRTFTASGAGLSMIMCRGDGTDYDMTQISMGATAPDNPTNGQLWLDQSGENDVLRQYSATEMDWIEVPSVYVKISGTGIGTGLQEYDAITISGLAQKDIENPTEEDEKIRHQIDALNSSAIVYGAGTDYIIIAGLLSRAVETTDLKDQTVHADRTVPDLDYICESNNRLWGCKYGLENGVVVNEIRASKLGDFRNWSCFMGLSTDSWTASIGTDGQFTGAIAQRGYPVFFKEFAIHRVSGTTPSSFSIQTTNARGVQAGSWRSLAIVEENIYYKSRDGIMLYDGNMPVSVSDQLGDELYSDARAGALMNTYYISMKDKNDAWHLFTYDTKRGIWYREDSLQALGFGTAEDEIYAIDEANNTLVSLMGSMGTAEADFEWMAEFGISGVEYTPTRYGKSRSDIAGNHYMSRFDIRMSLQQGAKAKLEIRYDEDPHWISQGEIRGKDMRSFILPVIPRRCDHLRFRLSGNGSARIYSIARYVEVGSDAV